MGRNKVQFELIKNKSTRLVRSILTQTSFYKRKKGLVNKAREFWKLCGVDIFLAFTDEFNNLYTLSNTHDFRMVLSDPAKQKLKSVFALDHIKPDNPAEEDLGEDPMGFKTLAGLNQLTKNKMIVADSELVEKCGQPVQWPSLALSHRPPSKSLLESLQNIDGIQNQSTTPSPNHLSNRSRRVISSLPNFQIQQGLQSPNNGLSGQRFPSSPFDDLGELICQKQTSALAVQPDFLTLEDAQSIISKFDVGLQNFIRHHVSLSSISNLEQYGDLSVDQMIIVYGLKYLVEEFFRGDSPGSLSPAFTLNIKATDPLRVLKALKSIQFIDSQSLSGYRLLTLEGRRRTLSRSLISFKETIFVFIEENKPEEVAIELLEKVKLLGSRFMHEMLQISKGRTDRILTLKRKRLGNVSAANSVSLIEFHRIVEKISISLFKTVMISTENDGLQEKYFGKNGGCLTPEPISSTPLRIQIPIPQDQSDRQGEQNPNANPLGRREAPEEAKTIFYIIRDRKSSMMSASDSS